MAADIRCIGREICRDHFKIRAGKRFDPSGNPIDVTLDQRSETKCDGMNAIAWGRDDPKYRLAFNRGGFVHHLQIDTLLANPVNSGFRQLRYLLYRRSRQSGRARGCLPG